MNTFSGKRLFYYMLNKICMMELDLKGFILFEDHYKTWLMSYLRTQVFMVVRHIQVARHLQPD